MSWKSVYFYNQNKNSPLKPSPLTTNLNYFNYFSEIEETFNRRRGKHLFLSPLDWALIETWQQRGIPLHIVLRGIEKVFDGVDSQPKRLRSVKSLMYCREEIEAQHAEWLERQVGKNGDNGNEEKNETFGEKSTFSSDAIQQYLEETSGELEKAYSNMKGDLRQTLERVLGRLSELKTSFTDAERLEEALTDLEKLIDAELLTSFANKEIESEVEKQLASYRNKMDAAAFKQTYDLMLLKRLREKAGVPRLSLFYL